MAAIAADHEISKDIDRTVRGLRLYSCDPFACTKEVHDIVLHSQLEVGEPPGFSGKKIEEIPLRHERNKFAMGRQAAEVGCLKCEVAKHTANRGQLLMGHFQEVFQQPQLVHHLQRGRMHRVAAKIAIEVGVLLQHRNFYPGPREQVAQHHAGWPSADNTTSSFDSLVWHTNTFPLDFWAGAPTP